MYVYVCVLCVCYVVCFCMCVMCSYNITGKYHWCFMCVSIFLVYYSSDIFKQTYIHTHTHIHTQTNSHTLKTGYTYKKVNQKKVDNQEGRRINNNILNQPCLDQNRRILKFPVDLTVLVIICIPRNAQAFFRSRTHPSNIIPKSLDALVREVRAVHPRFTCCP